MMYRDYSSIYGREFNCSNQENPSWGWNRK
jgi:hypothetical protein